MPKGFKKNNTLRKDGQSGIKKGDRHKKTILKEKLGVVTFEQLVKNAYNILDEAQRDNESRLSTGMKVKVDVAKTIAKIARPREININATVTAPLVIKLVKVVKE